MMTIEIKHRHTGAVLYTAQVETVREALERAVRGGANLVKKHAPELLRSSDPKPNGQRYRKVLNDMNTAERIGTEPVQKLGRSKQDYGTPWAFVRACGERFGAPTWDLAASEENAKATSFYSEADDSLKQDWGSLEGTLWLNPPFADIDPWAAKCAAVANRRGFTLLLTPASIGCTWFARHVLGKAIVLGISPRLTFEGTTAPYPKDLMLSVYGYGLSGFDAWRWTP